MSDNCRGLSWDDVPQNILSIIFSYLGQYGDRFNASLVNQSWCYVMVNSANLWKEFHFKFLHEDKLNNLKCLNVIGEHITSLYICVNPEFLACRKSAVEVIEYFAGPDRRQIEKLKLKFAGPNPLLYSGKEFNDALMKLFKLPDDNADVKHKHATLIEVDLSELKINLERKLLDVLAENHCKTLQKLYLHNCVLVETINTVDMENVASKCHQLTHLGLHGFCIDDDVINALTQPPERKKLERLIIFCRRDQKYVDRMTSKAWANLIAHSPDLSVSLGFDSTCPLNLVSRVMDPKIPVYELFLETYTDLHKEIRIAIRNYNSTLRKLSICCPPQHDERLETELKNVAKQCPLLSSLHVFCVLSQSTISEILSLKPILAERKSYTLESIAKPAPWTPGFDYKCSL